MFLAAVFGRLLERDVEQRDERVGAFDAEALGAQVGAVQEVLEAFHLRETLQQPLLLVGRERLRVHARLDLIPQPAHAGRGPPCARTRSR